MRFRTTAPGLRYAQPTYEHFTPLFVTLGAASDPTAPVTTAIDGFGIGPAKRSETARTRHGRRSGSRTPM